MGRTKEMYVRGGYNVYPVEVEAVLSTHPGVAVVAIGARGPTWVMGEIGVAVVSSRAIPARVPLLDELRDFVQQPPRGVPLPPPRVSLRTA